MSFFKKIFFQGKKYQLDEYNIKKIALLDSSVISVVTHFPLDHTFNCWTPFEEYNGVLEFSGSFSIWNGCLVNRPYNVCLDSLLSRKEINQYKFYFKDLDALNASKSSFSWNYNPLERWRDMDEFSRFAYFKHLPGTAHGVGNLEEDTNIYEQNNYLEKVFRDAQSFKKSFSSIIYKDWCNRYVLCNSGRSRRYAAISYLAREGEVPFTEHVTVPLTVEKIDLRQLTNLEKMADNYVFYTSKRYFHALRKVLDIHDMPVGFFRTKWSETDYRNEAIFMVSVLNEVTIDMLLTDQECFDSQKRLKDQYLQNINMIKAQLENLRDIGSILSLREFVDDVVEKSLKK